MPEAHGDILLEVHGLRVTRGSATGYVSAVEGVDFSLGRGETLAVVGESGSGKSSLASAIAGLLPSQTTRIEGKIDFQGKNLLNATAAEWDRVRGESLSIVFQDQSTALNPVMKVGKQVAEAIRTHHATVDRAEARRRTVGLFADVGINDPESRYDNYPHELSGGMRQRVLIAMAMANRPSLLIADEPTTALDVTIQAQVLQMLKRLQRESQMAMIFITHNMEVVADIADRVLVMRNGRVVERGYVQQVFQRPQHEYTRELLASIPRINSDGGRKSIISRTAPQTILTGVPALEVSDLVKTYRGRRGLSGTRQPVRAVADVSLSVARGATLGIVGESGSGKTTLARCVAGLVARDGGEIAVAGRKVGSGGRRRRDKALDDMQFVFQDPFESLDPSWTVRDIVGEPLIRQLMSRREREERVIEAIESVSMSPQIADRRPREFSGGERQRIAIARAVVGRPKVIVLDEPTASLDVSIQAKVVALLQGIQQRSHMSYVFITHDLALANNLCDFIAVMKDGRIVEQGPVDRIFTHPEHPYTQTLLASRHIWSDDIAAV